MVGGGRRREGRSLSHCLLAEAHVYVCVCVCVCVCVNNLPTITTYV